jgi:hypothetical protein
LIGLHCDADFNTIVEDEVCIWNAIDQLPLPPTKAVQSGHGVHLYWLFREALPATNENIVKVEQLLRALARHLAADSQTAEVSRAMRLPGTHNTKFGEWLPVEQVTDNPHARYEFNDLLAWMKTCGDPVLTRKPRDKEKANGDGNGHDENNAFLDFAAG